MQVRFPYSPPPQKQPTAAAETTLERIRARITPFAVATGLTVIAFAGLLNQAQAEAATATASPSILVTGQGTASLVPDIAALNLRVVTPGDSAPEALDANSEQLSKIIASLTKIGLEERDLQTSGFSINPRYADRRDTPDAPLKIIGYEVRNGLTIKVRDLAKLSSVLDQVVKAGANEMGGISFEVSNPEAPLNDARKAAVKDARAKAELYAEAAGAQLGKILLITEQSAGGRPAPMYKAEMAMMRADVPIQAGEETLSASVTIRFELIQPK
ncbi:SIMPL domain-containing protein [Roseibium sp.]|uniref:SIMPL domain-containing protein n=1 Tax=Roseibium sp. TaxID=1936156 RepID=UPI003A96A624